MSHEGGGAPRIEIVEEVSAGSPGRPTLRMEEWERRIPGLVAGLTRVVAGKEAGSDSDFGLSTGGDAWSVLERFEALARSLGLPAVAVGRQVHGSEVVTLDCSPERGVQVQGAADGITTEQAGVLLAVTVADCVPVYLCGPGGRAIGLVHAGWRGAATGVLEMAIGRMGSRHGVAASGLFVHLGPAICGSCYEVGPEVFDALGMEARGTGNLDLRSLLADRARRVGVPADRITRSPLCTRCGQAELYSHRGHGPRAGRMAAFLGRMAVSSGQAVS